MWLLVHPFSLLASAFLHYHSFLLNNCQTKIHPLRFSFSTFGYEALRFLQLAVSFIVFTYQASWLCLCSQTFLHQQVLLQCSGGVSCTGLELGFLEALRRSWTVGSREFAESLREERWDEVAGVEFSCEVP